MENYKFITIKYAAYAPINVLPRRGDGGITPQN